MQIYDFFYQIDTLQTYFFTEFLTFSPPIFRNVLHNIILCSYNRNTSFKVQVFTTQIEGFIAIKGRITAQFHKL